MANEILRYIELVEEPEFPDVDVYVPAAQGSGVYINQASTSLDVPTDTDIEVDTSFGRGASDSEPGYYAPSGNIAYPAVLPTLGHFLKGTLGGYAFTGGLAGTKEVQGFTVPSAADADGGTFTITLANLQRDLITYQFTTTAAQTAPAVATMIAAQSFAGWTVVAAGAVLTFTRSSGADNAPLGIFTPGSSGITAANFARTTPGVARDPNIHEFWGSDARILPSWLTRVGKDIFEHGFQGCVMESLEVAVEDALTNATCEMNAQKDFKAEEGLQSKVDVLEALPRERKIPFHQVNLTIDGVLQKRKAKNLTWNASNGTDSGAGRYLGTRFPGRIPANARAVTASTTLDFSDTDVIEAVWGSPTGPTNEGGTEFPARFDYAGGASVAHPTSEPLSMVVRFPRTKYASVETTPQGREEISQPVSFTARTGVVTLEDGTTKVSTEIYVKLVNYEPIIKPPV